MTGIKNPFANYGKIVFGDHFIGRKKEFRIFEERIIQPEDPGNLAIIGEPRIGKSSLVYQKIIFQKKELIDAKILPIWINTGNFEDSSSFFTILATQCYSEIVDYNLNNEKIKDAAAFFFSSSPSSNDRFYNLQIFFKTVHKFGIKPLFILDEFDHSRILFKGYPSRFQNLRDLSYYPECGVSYVTISRRSLHEIEGKAQASSTLDGVFLKHYLGMYDSTDIDEYYSKFQKNLILLTDADKNVIKSYCGNHPYLLAMLGYTIFENFRLNNHIEMKTSLSNFQSLLEDYYKSLIELHNQDGTLKKILQILFGPVIDVTSGDAERLVQAGLIIPHPSGTYHGFSEHFHDYLTLISREIEFWPIWCQTEKNLRLLISSQLEKKYGNNWVNTLETRHPKIKIKSDEWRKSQQNEQQKFGSRASNNILDFTYPYDLFEIISYEWTPVFNLIFKKEKDYWSQRGAFLAKIRNPLAHNRFECISEAERLIAEGYCKEILQTIQSNSQ